MEDDDLHAVHGHVTDWSTAPPSLDGDDDMEGLLDDAFDGDDWEHDVSGLDSMDCVEDYDFVKSNRFAGAKQGMVYKFGSRGMGYYRDEVRRGSTAQSTMLCLQELIPHPPAGCAKSVQQQQQQQRQCSRQPHERQRCEDVDMIEETEGVRRDEGAGRGRRKRAKRRPVRAHYEVPEEADCEDGDWKVAGLWAIDSANPNAWPGAVRYLERTAADAVLVQEVRRLGHQVESAEREARRNG